MTLLDRLTSWVAAMGTAGAARNARRAVEERAAAQAAVDALRVRLAATAPRVDESPPSHAA
jgi:hypothetical protein